MGYDIDIKTNLRDVYFLDVTFNFRKGSFFQWNQTTKPKPIMKLFETRVPKIQKKKIIYFNKPNKKLRRDKRKKNIY